MLSPGAGRQGLGLPPRSEILKQAPHPSGTCSKVWKVSKGAPRCWGLARVACSGSQGLLATHQQLLPALTAVLWPALCRKARSISSAEAAWTRRGGKRGRTVGCGAQRATETKSVGDSQEGRERREILTWKARESKRAQDMRKQRGERQWRGERGPNIGNNWWGEKERERHQDRERDRKRKGWGKEIPTNRQRWRKSVKEERGEREEKWR